MYSLQQWAAVQELRKRGRSLRSIAKELSMSRNTVKSLLNKKDQPKYQRAVTHSKLDAYKEQIYEWRCKPYEFNGTRIFRELKKRGYSGSIGPVYLFLRKIDEDTGRVSSKATVRVETPPGDQAQFDWAVYSVKIGNQEVKVYCFSLILSASRMKAVCFSRKDDADAIYEAIQELFDALGGVTLELLIDNPKALVIENNPKSEEEIRYNPQALLLAAHLGTELNACPCYWPRKKGKIEKPFQYIEEQFIKGNSFSSMEDLNCRGKQFIKEWCDEVHSTTHRIPYEYYLLEEKPVLLPLPKERFKTKKLQRRIVSPDSCVSIGASKYSVPVVYATKTVFFRIIYGFRIEIYDTKEHLILTLEAREKGSAVIDPDHYEPISKKTSTSIPQIRRDFTARYSNGSRYLEAAGKIFDQPTHYARKIMELEDLYETEILDAFIGRAVDQNKMDIKSFKKMLKENSKPENNRNLPSANTSLCDDELVRNLAYYDQLNLGGRV